MSSKYKIIFLITFLLLFLSVSISVMNYFIALNNAQKNLKETLIPLGIDSIYTEIQTHLIEPNIVASMMAQDTFLKDWLTNKEKNTLHVQRYLDSIKNKYQMDTVFLVSQNSMNYYSFKGFVEKVRKDNPANAWYYEFENSPLHHEVNIDINKHVSNSLIMFINHKIYDKEYHLLGITGVGLKLSYIDELLKRFRTEYKFQVSFVDQNAEIVIKEKTQDASRLAARTDLLIDTKEHTLVYEDKGEDYLLHSKFISELNLYLTVEVKIADFTSDVLRTFYINFFLSLFITIVVVFIITQMVHKYSHRLEYLANYDELTQLSKRRVFDDTLHKQIVLNERKDINMSILFFDIDNFKSINDTFGHDVGDKVLERFAQLIRESIRKSDCTARWGGEEFIVGLLDTKLENSKITSEKLRKNIENDSVLHNLLGYKLTASFGLTQMKKEDTVESILTRVDKALYEAKSTGKNKVVVA